MIMKSFEYVITEPVGIHARPAGLLSKEGKKYKAGKKLSVSDKNGISKITLNGKKVKLLRQEMINLYKQSLQMNEK